MKSEDTVNVPNSVLQKLGRDLYRQKNHPVEIIKRLVYEYFDSLSDRKFTKHEDLDPIVSVKYNFDLLLIPPEHPARGKTDTYYIDEEHVLRTHTSAHQNQLLSNGYSSFLVAGDVYRKDEIDATHYPVFHQMEGVYIDIDNKMTDQELQDDLINTLEGVCSHLFPNCPIRVNPDYFPFTHPSFEIEVFHKEKWIEILGCGIVQPKIIENCSQSNTELINNGKLKRGWAFGFGLDRLAMILFEIPDIRLLWVEDSKFLDQFASGQIVKFVPYSTLDPIGKDVSFWIPDEHVLTNPKQEIEDVEKYTDKKTGTVRIWPVENNMFEVIRETAEQEYTDIIESVEMMDQFFHPKKNMLSRMYRITYSPPDPNMNNPGVLTELANRLHRDISDNIAVKLGVEIR